MPDDVRVMSVAFHPPCELTRISHPSETLAAWFVQALVTAQSREREPFSVAHSAMKLVANAGAVRSKCCGSRLRFPITSASRNLT
jgi:hypothetical protein